MGTAEAVKVGGQVERFRFTETDTIGDLLATVNDLETRGRTPLLRFVGLTGERVTGLEILTQDQPNPAGLPEALRLKLRAQLEDVRWAGVTDETPVFFDGEWTCWGSLAGNERQMCTFTPDGDLVGCSPF